MAPCCASNWIRKERGTKPKKKMGKNTKMVRPISMHPLRLSEQGELPIIRNWWCVWWCLMASRDPIPPAKMHYNSTALCYATFRKCKQSINKNKHQWDQIRRISHIACYSILTPRIFTAETVYICGAVGHILFAHDSSVAIILDVI